MNFRDRNYTITSATGVLSYPWACGPPIAMKAPFLRFIDSKRVTCDFRRSVIRI
jgi:hypothetical protein